jgi:hypothetical protein
MWAYSLFMLAFRPCSINIDAYCEHSVKFVDINFHDVRKKIHFHGYVYICGPQPTLSTHI